MNPPAIGSLVEDTNSQDKSMELAQPTTTSLFAPPKENTEISRLIEDTEAHYEKDPYKDVYVYRAQDGGVKMHFKGVDWDHPETQDIPTNKRIELRADYNADDPEDPYTLITGNVWETIPNNDGRFGTKEIKLRDTFSISIGPNKRKMSLRSPELETKHKVGTNAIQAMKSGVTRLQELIAENNKNHTQEETREIMTSLLAQDMLTPNSKNSEKLAKIARDLQRIP